MTNSVIPTPASRFIARFGVMTLADWTGRHPTRIYAWAWPPERGGTGGVVPIRARAKIVDGARRDFKIEIGAAEFEPIEGEVYLLEAAA